MIASLTGTVAAKAGGSLVIDVHGVGYLVSVSPQLEVATNVGSSVSLHTALIVREDAFLLFGFTSADELRLFDILRSVSGVGPKTAMAILAQLGVDRISEAVVAQDDKVFSSVTGIGPKTAKLLVVALEGKVASSGAAVSAAPSSVLLAMVGLGWPEREANEAIDLVRKTLPATVDDASLLKAALALMANDKSQARSN